MLTKKQIVTGLREIGLKEGQVVLVHAAQRTFGPVQGGADTVVAALLEVLGPKGTLVVPAFTFAHEAVPDPVIDPKTDPSEMGAISETVRLRPEACRSTAYRHSFAAVGRWAEEITAVDPGLSPFDVRSSYGVMLALNAQVVLLGVNYNSSSTHHFAEWICNVPYRHKVAKQVKVRHNDGSVKEVLMTDYQPKAYAPSVEPQNSAKGSQPPASGKRRFDFGRIGKMLEERNLVGQAAIGNAIARRYAMRDLIDLCQVEAEKDYNVFRTAPGKIKNTDRTQLDFGKTVISEPMADGAGRMVQYEWFVVSEDGVFKR